LSPFSYLEAAISVIMLTTLYIMSITYP
jgi:hypothetical protein